MNYKIIISTGILIIISFFSYSQETTNFSKILSSGDNLVLKEKKMDSFFSTNRWILPSLDIGEYYHQYGLWYYKEWRKNKDQSILKKAILYTKKAKNIKENIEDIDIELLNKTTYNLGFFNFKGNHFFEAIKNYSEVIENYSKISVTAKSKKKIIICYTVLGEAYTKIGDYHKAIYYINKGIKLATSNNIYITNSIDGYIQCADTYSLMGHKKYTKEIQFNLKKGDSIIALITSNTKRLKNRIHLLEGNRLLMTGKYEEALNPLSDALKGIDIKDSLNIAKVHNSIGLSLFFIEKYSAALKNLQSAISYSPKLSLPYENLGDLYIEKKEFKKGLYQYQKAINYSVANYEEPTYNDLIDVEKLEVAINKYHLLHHLIQKANGWMQYFRHDQNKSHLINALKTFKIADQLVDIIRFESAEYKSKLFWREQGSALYMKAVEACYLIGKPEEAYYFMEKNKALLLLEDITNEQAKENTMLPQEVAKREFLLKQEIYLSENELNISKNRYKDTILAIKDKVYRNKRLYEKFVDSIAKIYPEYAKNKQKIIVLPYASFTKKYISDQEVVLQYILDKDQGYGLLTTSRKSIFFEIKNVLNLQENINRLRKQSSNWFSNQEQVIAYQKNANTLFKKLVPQHVYALVKEKKITIVPDYTLQQVSFDVLITSKQPDSYFIKDTEIRYAYSMSYLDRKDQIKTTAKYSFIGFAPVTFTTTELGDLILSKNEVNSISHVFNGNSLTEEKATKTNFLNSIQEYKIIHLSTHADIGDIVDPWIAFRNEKLSLQEIYATKTKSDMVVLSACKTSLGRLEKGEGVMSLARGFFHSGAKSVISSLWSVNDKANKELMVDFYKGIAKGLTKSKALRDAKLNYINTHDGTELSPFYWGALILIGDNTSIDLYQKFSNWYWATFLMVLMLILGVFYARKKYKRLIDNNIH